MSKSNPRGAKRKRRGNDDVAGPSGQAPPDAASAADNPPPGPHPTPAAVSIRVPGAASAASGTVPGAVAQAPTGGTAGIVPATVPGVDATADVELLVSAGLVAMGGRINAALVAHLFLLLRAKVGFLARNQNRILPGPTNLLCQHMTAFTAMWHGAVQQRGLSEGHLMRLVAGTADGNTPFFAKVSVSVAVGTLALQCCPPRCPPPPPHATSP